MGSAQHGSGLRQPLSQFQPPIRHVGLRPLCCAARARLAICLGGNLIQAQLVKSRRPRVNLHALPKVLGYGNRLLHAQSVSLRLHGL